jgi:hypothetical protein
MQDTQPVTHKKARMAENAYDNQSDEWLAMTSRRRVHETTQ